MNALSVFMTIAHVNEGESVWDVLGRHGIKTYDFEVQQWGPTADQYVVGFWCVDRKCGSPWMGDPVGELDLVQQVDFDTFLEMYRKRYV